MCQPSSICGSLRRARGERSAKVQGAAGEAQSTSDSEKRMNSFPSTFARTNADGESHTKPVTRYGRSSPYPCCVIDERRSTGQER